MSPRGIRLQSGIPKSAITPRRPNGLLLRGVVTDTFVTDSAGHPQTGAPQEAAPVAVYCNVLVVPSMSGQRFFGLQNVLVSQDVAGLHRGRIWKPRPARIDFVDGDINLEEGSSPGYVDGDHVLIGFMDNNFDLPVILRSLPHPTGDLGRDKYDLGTRMKLVEADGDPDFLRHHGVFYGVDNSGNFILDSTFANKGTLDNEGKESAPATDGTSGNQTFNLPQDSNLEINLMDMTDPENPDPKVTIQISKTTGLIDIKDATGNWYIKVEDGETLKVEKKDDQAMLTLGDGAVAVAIANHLQTLWGNLRTEYLKHKHPSGSGPTGIPDTPLPAYDTAINSNRMTIPDNP